MILIDTREQEREFIETRLNALNIDTTITCLEHGMDYMIVGTYDVVGVQRKTFPEICTQMQEIREDIIPALMDLTESAVLLVEEYFQIDNQGMMWRKEGNYLKPANISARMYYNFLQSMRQMGCDIVVTRELANSIWWMYGLHSYIHEFHYPKQKKRYGAEMQALGALCCINNFGPTIGKKLLKDHTIHELLNMKDSELGKIMTKNQVYNFRRVFGGTHVPSR
jgi:hypothetical protein